MLEAAQRQDWEGVACCERVCAVQIARLREAGQEGQVQELSPEERRERVRIMQRILHNDAQIRVLAEPWLDKLDGLLSGGGFKLH